MNEFVDDGEAYQAFCLQCFDTVSWAPGRAMASGL